MNTLRRTLFCKIVSVVVFWSMLAYLLPQRAAAYPSLPQTDVTTDFGYDGNGNLVSRVDGNGQTTTFSYDAMNRLAGIVYPGGSSPDAAFTYDVNGNRKSMTDATGLTNYYYDLFDRLTGIDYPGLNFIRYTYDYAGNITDLQYGNWMMVWIYGSYTYIQYAYDEDNRISSVTNVFTGDVTAYQYDRAGNVTRRDLPNGAYTLYDYDVDGRLTSVDHRASGGGLICSYVYTLNAIGNRTQAVETTPSGTKTTAYTYDALDRLDTVTYPGGRFVDYDYDTWGNRTKMTEVDGPTKVTDYFYDSDSRLLYTKIGGVEAEHFFYDGTGNLIQRVGVGAGVTHQIEYVYDSENRLVRYYDGTNNVEYVYSGVGERVAKIANGVRTNFLNDPNRDYVQALMELDENGIPTAVREWGNELINAEDYAGGNRHYYLHDSANGSVRRMIDSAGAVTNSYEYDAFGEVKSEVEGVANDYQFHGEAQEEETGLVFLRARGLDPVVGRFIQRDPMPGVLGQPLTSNPYCFVLNDPVNQIDPSGEFGWGAYLGSDRDAAKYGSRYQEYQQEDPWQRAAFRHDWTLHDIHERSGADWWNIGNRDVLGAHLSLIVDFWAASFSTSLSSSIGQGLAWEYSHRSEADRIRQDYLGSSWDRSDRSNPFFPPWGGGGSASRVGGVALNRTAEVLLDINKIKGGTYDPATGQLIIYGEQDASLPAMNIDDLAVAARAAAQDASPVVSIDPPEVAGNYSVRYGPSVPWLPEGEWLDLSSKTHFGYVMFEADRVMKTLALGKDNITGAPVTSSVPGYINMADRWLARQSEGGSTARFWFQPESIKLVPSPDGGAMVFSEAKVALLTESKFLSNGQVFGDPDAEAFADHFTAHYDGFAAEFPIFEELRQLAKIVGIMKWIRENNIPMDLSQIEQHEPAYYEAAPFTTPKTSVTRTWREYISGGYIDHTLTVEGGVNYFKNIEYLTPDPGPGSAVAAARPNENSLAWTHSEGGTDYNVAAVSLEKKAKDGGMSRSDTDLSLQVNGALPLTLARHFNSFDVSPSMFGWGWTSVPYQLNFAQDLVRFNTDVQQYEGYGEIWYADRPGQGVYKYRVAGIYDKVADPLGIAGRFDPAKDILVYRYETKEVPGLLFTDHSSELMMLLYNGVKLDFDMNGMLTQTVDRNGNAISYTYDGNGRLASIGQTASGRSIGFTYDGNGRVAGATDTGGQTASYSYDGAGNLASAQVNGAADSLIQYAYDPHHNLQKVKNADGDWMASKDFDVYGRVASVSQPGVATPFTQDYDLGARTTQVTGPESFSQAMEYDENYNLTQLTDGRGNDTTRSYNSFQDVVSETNAEGRTSAFYYSPRGDRIAATAPSGRPDVRLVDAYGNPTLSFHVSPSVNFAANFDAEHYFTGFTSETLDNVYAVDLIQYAYDLAGNPTRITDARGNERDFGYDSRGNRIWSQDARNNQTDYTYDSYSRLTRVANAEGHAVDYTYDGHDNVTRIATAAGTVDNAYDAKNRLASVTTGDPSARHTTAYSYNKDDQLETVTDPAGAVTAYEYDARGNLTRITHASVARFEYEYDGLNRLSRIRYFGTVGSAAAKASVVPVSPVGGESLQGDILIQWKAYGNWSGNENLEIYYTTNGTTWNLIATVNHADGSYLWHSGEIGPPFIISDSVQFKFVRPGDASFRAPVTSILQVLNGGKYYVNDGSVTNDMYCTAAGQTYNGSTVTGQTPNDPVNSVQAIINNYALRPGDIIYVDTGNYTITSDITFDSSDNGTSAEPVTIMGSTRGAGTVITRTSSTAWSACIFLFSVQHLNIENLKLTRAQNGILLYDSAFCTIKNNECYVNGLNGGAGQVGNGAGIYVAYGGVNIIENNICRGNGGNGGASSGVGVNGGIGLGRGIAIESSVLNTLRNNRCYSNTARGGAAGSSSNAPGDAEVGGIMIFTSDPGYPSDGNEVVDNTCYDNDAFGVNETSSGARGGTARSFGIALVETLNSTIERNTTYDNDALGGYSSYSHGGGGYTRGIYGQDEDSLTVLKNVSYSNYGQGGRSGTGVEDYIGTGRGVGMELSGCSNSILKNNLAYDNAAATFKRNGSEQLGGAQGMGILFVESTNCQIDNNTLLENYAFIENGSAGYVLASQVYVGAASQNSEIRNNVLESIPHYEPIFCIRVEADSQTGLSSDYNILFNNGDTGWTGVWGGTGWRYFSDWKTNSGQDTHSLASDPLFYDAANRNYHLAYSSPAIDAGTNLASVQSDGDGEARPADGPDADLIPTHDIGYDEYVDTDADELSDWIEDNVTGTDKSLRDSDGDGMHDGWEVRNLLNPNSALGDDGADGDPDGDTYTNIEEYPGYDPRDPNNHPDMAPVITSATPAGNTMVIVEGQTVAFSVTAFDADGETISYRWFLDGVEQSTSNSWTLVTNDESSGEHTVRVDVSAGGDTVFRGWTVFISNLNRPPVIDPLSLPNQARQIGETVLLSPVYSDPDNENGVPNDDNVLTVSYSGWMTGPSKLLVPGDGGVHTVTVTVSDNGNPALTDSQLVTITVSGEPDIRIEPNQISFRSEPDGSIDRPAVLSGTDGAPVSGQALDLSNPLESLGRVSQDEIIVRFATKQAARVHANRIVKSVDAGQLTSPPSSDMPLSLPAAIAGIRPFASGEARARRLAGVKTNTGAGATSQPSGGGDAQQAAQVQKAADAIERASEPFDPVSMFNAKLRAGADTRAVCLELMKRPDVVYAHPSPIYELSDAPNDPLYSRQWNLTQIGVQSAWTTSGNTLAGIKVCVVDTGVRITHSEFANRIAAPKDVYLGNGDAYGDSNPDNDDPDGHGTASAGIIASYRGNNHLVAGIAPVTIIPVNAAIYDSGQWKIANYTDGILWGVDNGAHVISLSFGGYRNAPYQAEIDAANYAASHGVLVCAGAGNDNNEGTEGGVPKTADNHYPSAISSYMSVAAVDDDSLRVAKPKWWWGSNYGDTIDVCAPGQGNVGVAGDSILTLGNTGDNAYINNFNGTSAATPHVAALASLLKHVNPFLSAGEIRAIIENTARDAVGDPGEDTPGKDPYHGYGLIDAAAAVEAARGGASPQKFVIHNDGDTDLEVTGVTKQTGAAWLSFAAESGFPIVIPHDGVTTITLTVDLSSLMPGNYSERLIVASTDPNENPYPDGVYVNLTYTVPEPSVSLQPESQTVCRGACALFSVTAAGAGPLSYQWKKNNVLLLDGGDVSGATSSTLTISNVEPADRASYICLVSNAFSSVESNPATLDLDQHALTMSADPPAGGSVTGAGTYECGSTATLTALPIAGHGFIEWRGDVPPERKTENPLLLIMNQDRDVTACFAINQYTLTYTAGANGSIDGASSVTQTVDYGTSGTAVTAVPATGYHFLKWSDDSTQNPRTDTNVTANVSVTASFAIDTFTLTYTAGPNGSIDGASSVTQTVDYGTSGTAVTAVPATGYHFLKWSDDSTQNPRTDTNVTADITVTAIFAINQYHLAYAAGENGSIDGATSQTVAHGGSGTAVTAVPAMGYHFVSWSDARTDNPRTDTGVTGDITVTATFAINTYTLTYTAGANGTIDGATSQTIAHGGSGTAVTAVPATGYRFVQWSDGSTQNPRTDTNVTADMTLVAAFEVVATDPTLAAHWKLDDGSGTTAADSSGNGNHGALLPAPPNGPAWTTGHLNGALDFDGTNDYVNLGTSGFGATSEITIAFWVRPAGTGTGYQALVARSGFVHPFRVRLAKSTGRIETGLRTTAGTNYLTSARSLALDTWHHVALTYKSGNRVIYINGVADASNAPTGNLTQWTDPTMLGSTGGTSEFFRGAMDDVRIYNRALSAQEVEWLVRPPSPDTEPPTIPQRLTAAAVSSSQINLSWDPSTDNVGVTGYRIYRAGNAITTTTATSYQNTGLDPATSYTYRVLAFDAAGNESGLSAPASATTQGGGGAGVLTVTPAESFVSSGSEGGPFSPANKIYTLSNTGGSALNWTASKTAAWLDLSVPTSGTLAPGASVAVTVSVNSGANGLPAGIYTDTLTLTNATAAISETRGVQLTVVTVSPDPSLKAHWKLDDGSGITASDSSGNGNHATLLPAPPNGPAWTTGHLNGALGFDGANDYVSAGTSNFGATSEITVAFWVYATGSGTGYQTLIARSPYVRPFAVELSKTTGKFRSAFRTAAGVNYLNSNAVLPMDSWHHFAVTYRSGERVIYLDGALDSSNAPTGNLAPYPSETTTLGSNGVGQYFRGRLDDVRIYNRALTAQEVEGLVRPPSPDTEPPSIPQNLTAAAVSSSQINLSWDPSTDNVGVTGYRIYRAGTAITTTAATSYQNTGLDPATSYTYRVLAFDAAGNESGLSAPASATTQGGGGGGVLTVAPAEPFASSGPQGGPFSPASKVYTLSNTGGSALNWTASKTSAWLGLSVPTSGTLAPGASVPVEASINANANALAVGVTTDTLTFTNATAGVSETRDVQLTVVTAGDPSLKLRYGLLEFDGIDDYVNAGTSDFGATSEITIAFWVYATGSGTGYQTIIARSRYVRPFAVELSKTTGKLRSAFRTAAGTNYLNSNAVLPLDSWHHFAVTYRSGERVIYMDGVRDSSNAPTGNLAPYPSDTTTLGTNGVGQFFRGRLDDLRLYNRALSAQEIQALADTVPPPIVLQGLTASATVASAQQQPDNGEGELAAKAKPDPPAKEMRLVIEHLYLNILAREPGADEIAEWAGRISRSLEQGIHVRLAVREMALALFGSKEYTDRRRSDEQFLVDCYRAFALRDPSAEELAAWDAPLRDRSAAINTLMDSPAFTNMLSVLFPNSDGGTTESCVAALYLDIHRRLPTTEELASGCSSLEVSQDKKQALQKLVECLSPPQPPPIEDPPTRNRPSIRDGSRPVSESCREWTNAYLLRE